MSDTHTKADPFQTYCSAIWAADRAAEEYRDSVLEDVHKILREEALDPRRQDEEVSEILWEILDSHEALIYTARAEAIVQAAGPSAHADFVSEYGTEVNMTPEAIAHHHLASELSGSVSDLEDEREAQEEAQ
jgi:hypothetical protein